MTLLTATLTVTCPRTGNTVDVKKQCIDNCKQFKHISYRGLTPYVACSHEKPEPQPEPETKEVEGLKRW